MTRNLSPIRILHLEDYVSDAALVAYTLKRNGLNHNIHVVETKEAFLTALKSFQPDIILSDHNLPGFTSVDALQIVKESDLNIPFILVSGSISGQFAIEMFKNGVDDVVSKDRPEHLIISIENVLAKAKFEREKLQFEERILQSERRFRRIIELGSDVVFILNPEGKVDYMSPSVEKNFGIKSQEVEHNCLVNILKPEHPEILRDSILKCIADRDGENFELEISTNNEQIGKRWFKVKFRNLVEDPEVNGIMGVFRNVTQEKIALLNLEGSEHKYRTFFENSLDGILLTGVDGKVHAANPAACEIFGMSEAEICERGREKLCDQSDIRLQKALKNRSNNGSTQAEIGMIRKDGSVFPAEISSSVFQLENEFVPLTSTIIRDVTDKKRIVEELQKSEIRYKSLFNFNPLPVFMFNEYSLEIIDVNPSACRHYGYTLEEFVGMPLQAIRPASEVNRLETIIEEHKNTKETSWKTSAIHSKKDGTIINVEIDSHRFFIDKTSYLIAVCKDVTESKRNVEKLIDSTEKLQLAEKIAKLGYWEYDVETDTIYCSDEVYAIYGVEKNTSFDLQNFKDCVHPEDLSIFLKEEQKVLSGEKGHDLQYRIIAKNGDEKWVHARSKLIKDDQGEILTAKGTIQDITSQKKTTEELVKSEARYKGLFYSQTNYFVRISMQGIYTYVNNKFKEEFGWLFPEGDPVGHNALTDVMEYHHKDIAVMTQKMIAEPNKTFQLEIDKQVFEQEPKTTLWDMTYIKDEHSPGEIQCVGIDISSRVKVERENRFQADLLNKIGQGIIAANVEGEVTYWNYAAESMYGWSAEEAIGEKLDNLLALNGKCFFRDEIQSQLKAGESIRGEEVVSGKDAIDIPIQFISSPIFNNNKEFQGFICLTSDISDLKKSELKLKKLNKELKDHTKELVSANKGLEQFSYIVSHNLRAPVANILGIANILEDGDHEKSMESILRGEMFSNVKRLDQIVRDLNDILNVKSDFAQKREDVDLELIIKDIIASNKNLVEENDVTVVTDFTDINKFKTVKSYIYSIFFNLIGNSIKYRKKDVAPKIKVSSAIREDNVILMIEDNGMGLDLKKSKKQLFGLYKRFHTHVEGKGMGLFMVKTQVQILGGNIEVESEAGVGTKFIISLKKD